MKSSDFGIDEAITKADGWIDRNPERPANAILIDCEGVPTMLHVVEDAPGQHVVVPFTTVSGAELRVAAVREGYVCRQGRRFLLYREVSRQID